MKHIKNYINSNTITGLIGIIIFVGSICLRLAPYNIPNYQTIMSDTISFASFITCLMFIGLAYLPSQNDSKFIKAAQDLQTSIILMHQILITITIYFSIAIVCVISLGVSTANIVAIPLTSLWLSLFITGVIEVTTMISELFRIILYIAKKQSPKY